MESMVAGWNRFFSLLYTDLYECFTYRSCASVPASGRQNRTGRLSGYRCIRGCQPCRFAGMNAPFSIASAAALEAASNTIASVLICSTNSRIESGLNGPRAKAFRQRFCIRICYVLRCLKVEVLNVLIVLFALKAASSAIALFELRSSSNASAAALDAICAMFSFWYNCILDAIDSAATCKISCMLEELE